MKISKHFVLQEFVPPDIFKAWGEKSIWFIKADVVRLAEFYREFFNVAITINNWHIGGKFTLRGFRPPGTDTGAAMSQHKFGNAFDCDVRGMTAEQVRIEILKNEQRFLMAGLRCLESNVTWVHSDCRNMIESNKILIVNP